MCEKDCAGLGAQVAEQARFFEGQIVDRLAFIGPTMPVTHIFGLHWLGADLRHANDIARPEYNKASITGGFVSGLTGTMRPFSVSRNGYRPRTAKTIGCAG